MRSVLVTAPDDSGWTVRVVWEPRWRALARRFGGWRRKQKNRDGFDLDDAIIVLVVVFLAVIAAALLFWWVLLPLLLIAIDLVVVLVLLVLALVGRALFRRPWTVQVTAGNGERVTAEVVGGARRCVGVMRSPSCCVGGNGPWMS